MSAARFIVTGHVQGVCFRASTRERALALGLRGSAVNRADGSVEVCVAGDAEALDALERWLGHGPAHARVEAVRREPLDQAAVGKGFATG